MNHFIKITLLIFATSTCLAQRWESKDINRDGHYVCHPIATDGSVLPNQTGDYVNCTVKFGSRQLYGSQFYGCFPVDSYDRALTKFPIHYSNCKHKFEARDGNYDGISHCYVTDLRGNVMIDSEANKLYRQQAPQVASRLSCQGN